jgi:hypothetical protein
LKHLRVIQGGFILISNFYKYGKHRLEKHFFLQSRASYSEATFVKLSKMGYTAINNRRRWWSTSNVQIKEITSVVSLRHAHEKAEIIQKSKYRCL